jgi:putative polyhydroxyalkanoate system protein
MVIGLCSYPRNVAHLTASKKRGQLKEIAMPSIDIRRKHNHSLKEAKEAVRKTAIAMGNKFDIKSAWEGNTLKFERPGATGEIHVTASDVHVTAQLGFLLGTLKPMIESEIQKQLDKQLA